MTTTTSTVATAAQTCDAAGDTAGLVFFGLLVIALALPVVAYALREAWDILRGIE